MSENTLSHQVARRVVRPLVGTGVTPNQLTALRLVTGLAAAVAFAIGSDQANIWGGALFVASAFLDRADGELARLAHMRSASGHRYDILCDRIANVALFVGIGIGLRASPLGPWSIALGLIAGAGIIVIYRVRREIARVLRRRQPADSALPRTDRLFDLDDVLYLVGPIAWAGGLLPFLLAAAPGAPAYALWQYWRYRRLRQVAAPVSGGMRPGYARRSG